MSRSKRKNPIIGNTTKPSEKDFKRQESKRLRAKVRSKDLEADPREFKTMYGPKDGKHYVDSGYTNLLRK